MYDSTLPYAELMTRRDSLVRVLVYRLNAGMSKAMFQYVTADSIRILKHERKIIEKSLLLAHTTKESHAKKNF